MIFNNSVENDSIPGHCCPKQLRIALWSAENKGVGSGKREISD
jgi:hypothetical protein